MTTHKHNSKQVNRALFLCCCLIHGFDHLHLDTCDISPSVYFDIARYDPQAFRQIDSMAQEYIRRIEPSVIKDHMGKKSIIAHSITWYKSDSIKRLIKSMDIYLLKEDD